MLLGKPGKWSTLKESEVIVWKLDKKIRPWLIYKKNVNWIIAEEDKVG